MIRANIKALLDFAWIRQHQGNIRLNLSNSFELFFIHFLALRVARRGSVHFFDVFVGEFTHDFRGGANDEPAIRKNFAFRHERAGTDQTVLSDNGAVHDNGLDADQRAVADRAAV